eukprot:2598366-Prymnesium_polylepis.1
MLPGFRERGGPVDEENDDAETTEELPNYLLRRQAAELAPRQPAAIAPEWDVKRRRPSAVGPYGVSDAQAVMDSSLHIGGSAAGSRAAGSQQADGPPQQARADSQQQPRPPAAAGGSG